MILGHEIPYKHHLNLKNKISIGSRPKYVFVTCAHERKHQYIKKNKNLRPKILIEYNSLPMPTLDSIGLLG